MVHTVHAWQIKLYVVNNAIKNTRMLQFFCALLDIVLGASVSDHHQHLGNIPPHAAVWGEDFLIDMFQSDSWIKKRGTDYQIWTISCLFIWDAPDDDLYFFGLQWFTCLCVSSSVADSLQSWQHNAFVMVRVELELSLGVVAVLHQWNLFKRDGLHIMWTKGTKTSFFMACQMEHFKKILSKIHLVKSG